ncbi:response regulator [Sphingomonas sp. RS6]
MNQRDGGMNEGRRRLRPTILAIGPDRQRLNPIAQRLGDAAYMVVLAESGRAGIDLITAGGFDLVLVEERLPDMSGMALLAEIRGHRDTADLPILFLLAEEAAARAAQALSAGADDCCTRDTPFELLAARIERTMARAGRLEALKRANLALDARVAARAIELGEARSALAAAYAEQRRLGDMPVRRPPYSGAAVGA